MDKRIEIAEDAVVGFIEAILEERGTDSEMVTNVMTSACLGALAGVAWTHNGTSLEEMIFSKDGSDEDKARLFSIYEDFSLLINNGIIPDDREGS